jgi:PqqD family protein of HPr-rel-A system
MRAQDDHVAVILPPRRCDVQVYDFGDQAVLHDAARGDLTLLNRTAAAVWRRCDGSATVPAIAEELVRDYEVDADLAQDHVEQLVSRFARSGLFAEGG